MATKRQTWAIFCATGLDARGLPLSVDTASELIDRCNIGDTENVVKELQEMGATGKPKKPSVDWAPVWQEACAAGRAAAEACIPRPMVVCSHANPLDDSSPVEQSWHVPDGVCGFAWIWLKGNESFGRWAKKENLARKSYPSGLSIWVSQYNQSMERKEAFARAAADVLKRHGVTAYAQSRMD